MSVKKIVMYVDEETGEVIKKTQKKVSDIGQKSKPDRFFWLFFKITDPLPYTGAEIAGLSGVVRKMRPDNILTWNGKEPADKTELALRIAGDKTTGYKRIIEWKKTGLLLENDGVFSLNPQVVRKGNLRGIDRVGMQLNLIEKIKIAYDGIDAVVKYASLNKLGKLTSLIPHLNLEHNIISDYPYETEWDDVVPMSPLEISKAWGNKTCSVKNVNSYLLEPRIVIRGHEQAMVKLIDGKYVINPRIFYGGSQFQEVAKKFSE